MSWQDSKANCLGYGADLVSIHDSSEVNFINQETSKLSTFWFWIGLYRNKTTNDAKVGWIWSDGSNLTNPQWARGEPNNYRGNEKCGEIHTKRKLWNDNDCSKQFASICKRKKGLPDLTTPTAGTLPPTKLITSKGCPKNWKEHGNSCYLFVNPTLRNRLNWEDSKANCLGYGADLVSIHDSSEVNFINQETSKLSTFWFWIGLYRNKTTNDAKVGWIWSDGSNLTNPQWARGEPNNYRGNEKCGEIHTKRKLWNDNDCSKQFASICKRKKGLPDLTTPTAGTLPPTKLITSKGCPKNWKEHGNSCYLFVNPTLKFETSKLSTFWFWIGLYRKKTTNDAKVGWIWSDGSNLTNPQWARGEPNNYRGNEKCGEIHTKRKLWNDNDCSKQFASICKRKKGLPDLTTPTAGTLPPTKSPSGSGLGYIVKTTNDAKVGWIWSDGSNLTNPQWARGEPNNYRGNEKCGEIHTKRKLWNDNDCSKQFASICKRKKGLPDLTTPTAGTLPPTKLITSKGCPKNWKEHGNSCYLFVNPTLKIRLMSWQDSKANCLGYGADLVSIHDSSEVNFINQETSKLSTFWFWIGLYRKKTTNDAKVGWIWSDGSNLTNPQWARGEPNNYRGNEKCGEIHTKRKLWNDNDCSKQFASICKKKKGLPDLTTPTAGTLPPTKCLPDLTTPTAGSLPPTKYSPPKCDHGWISYNRSCYRIFSNPRNWFGAKSACRDTGGHLVRIDDDNEQKFLAYEVFPRRDTAFWLGLNDLATAGQWVWEFRSGDSLVFKNWQTGEPNGLGRERCVEMYGFAPVAGRWNDAYCNGPKSYICEKEEGQNICPEGWIPYNDTCYQFNMRPSQKMTWTEAEAACNAIGNFASLVQINSQNEQDFVSKRIKSISNEDAWIGLSDLGHENVFLWTATNSELESTGYKIWANGNPTENAENRDCVMILGARNDGAWAVKNCTLKRNFVCMRNRDLTYCNGPLGMENGKISDSQIIASSYSPGNEPARARLRHSGAWCPVKASQNEYLQVEFPFLADIRMIVTEGNLSTYKLKIGKDGKTFKDYNAAKLTLMQDETYNYTKFNSSLIAKAVRIFPLSWKNNPCFRVEFVGCRAPGAEIIPTTQQTAQKVSFRITSIDWNDRMSDSKSKEFAETSKMIIKEVETVYSKSESFRSAKVLKLTKGSVVTVIELTFNPEFDDDDNGTLNLKAAVESGEVGSLKVDKGSYKKLGEENIQDSTGDDSGSLSRGAVAGIVITVLVLLALAAGGAFLFYRRRHPIDPEN
ncbi:macrophage mannose receptor 1-like [Dendronephthya gigantea]|uniref:macrophage mannose receptor 1-like n=1 Tax=Dendronephthya gigantea TaxID=151771 RepID=UPI001069C081|nr:macrophage mannose receptor 1-like [Dendronephthya gigantea]